MNFEFTEDLFNCKLEMALTKKRGTSPLEGGPGSNDQPD